MTQNRHTPGPWRIGKSGGSVVTDNEIENAVGGSWGEDAKTFYGGNLIAESITPANARLIAAAPDLLEACQAFVDAYRKSLPFMDVHMALGIAKQAIEKVVGNNDQDLSRMI